MAGAQKLFYASVVLVWDVVDAVKTRRQPEDRDRGDVPGWVMITVMTSIMVIAILAIFGGKIKDVIVNAFNRVDTAKTP